MNGDQKFWLSICLIVCTAAAVESYFDQKLKLKQAEIEQQEATKRTQERMEWNPWYSEGEKK